MNKNSSLSLASIFYRNASSLWSRKNVLLLLILTQLHNRKLTIISSVTFISATRKPCFMLWENITSWLSKILLIIYRLHFTSVADCKIQNSESSFKDTTWSMMKEWRISLLTLKIFGSWSQGKLLTEEEELLSVPP